MNASRIDSDQLLSLFSQLVSKDSPSLDERAVCDFLKATLHTIGITAIADSYGLKSIIVENACAG